MCGNKVCERLDIRLDKSHFGHSRLKIFVHFLKTMLIKASGGNQKYSEGNVHVHGLFLNQKVRRIIRNTVKNSNYKIVWVCLKSLSLL